MRRSLLALSVAAALGGCATEAPSPTIIALPPGRADIDWSRAQPVEVVLQEFSFEPSRIELAAGQPYLLRLRNAGRGGHNFVAPAFFRGAVTREAAPPDGGIELAQGEVKEIALVPLRAGEYPLECTHLLHSLFGMTGEISVK